MGLQGQVPSPLKRYRSPPTALIAYSVDTLRVLTEHSRIRHVTLRNLKVKNDEVDYVMLTYLMGRPGRRAERSRDLQPSFGCT